MIKKTAFWSGITLFFIAAAMGVIEKLAVYNLKTHMKSYGEVELVNPRLYFDGLMIDRVTITEKFTLTKVLFSKGKIKKAQAVEVKIDHIEKSIPVGLNDFFITQNLTIYIPFFTRYLKIKGELETLKKSNGHSFYRYSFRSDEEKIEVEGVADFTLKDKKISTLSVELEEGKIHDDLLKAHRVTGWFDYDHTTLKQAGVLTIGSMEWQDQGFDNVQIMLNDQDISFAANLEGKTGEIDGDIHLGDEFSKWSFIVKFNDRD